VGGRFAITFENKYGPLIPGGAGGNGRISIGFVNEKVDVLENITPQPHVTSVVS